MIKPSIIRKCSLLSKSSRAFASAEKSITIELVIENFLFNFFQPKCTFVDLDEKWIPKTTTTNKTELMSYFKLLTTMRRMEYECDLLYKSKDIRGFCHLYIGQEAIAAGMEAGITKEDAIITGYREHCTFLARGDTPYRIIAEMMSRSTGSTKGKGGSMHYYSREKNFYGGHGIVGAQIPLGTGIAFAMKYLGKKNACFTLYGDGCSNQGQIYEACNMAGLWKIPVVFTIENNLYGMGTSVERASYVTSLMSKFRGFPGLRIDAQNIFMVREAAKFCKNFVIENGPMFLELDTYRYQGHSMVDAGITYRTREEVEKQRATRDCINKVRQLLVENSFATEKELKEIENGIRDSVEKDIEKIKTDPLPMLNELYTDIYVNNEPHFIRGVNFETSVTHPKH